MFDVPTVLVGTLEVSLLGFAVVFFHHERGLALRTRLGDGAIPKGIVTLGIPAAGKEELAFFGPFLNEISSAIRLRALDACAERLGVFTVGIF